MSVLVTMQMHGSGYLLLTRSCLEEDKNRWKCAEKSADDSSSLGRIEEETKYSATCSSRVSLSDIKESPAAWLLLEVSVPNDNQATLAKEDINVSVYS